MSAHQYEIGLCPAGTGPASVMVGPFPDMKTCLDYYHKLPSSPPGKAYLWARCGEMQRTPDCKDVKPEGKS